MVLTNGAGQSEDWANTKCQVISQQHICLGQVWRQCFHLHLCVTVPDRDKQLSWLNDSCIVYVTHIQLYIADHAMKCRCMLRMLCSCAAQNSGILHQAGAWKITASDIHLEINCKKRFYELRMLPHRSAACTPVYNVVAALASYTSWQTANVRYCALIHHSVHTSHSNTCCLQQMFQSYCLAVLQCSTSLQSCKLWSLRSMPG